MTKRLRRVQRAKREAYIRAGTCSVCHASFVASNNSRGLCRSCRAKDEAETVQALVDEKATLFFRYYCVCRKKAVSDIGRLARTYLAHPEWFEDLKGLQALAEGTPERLVDVKVLERAWDESEAERRVAEAG